MCAAFFIGHRQALAAIAVVRTAPDISAINDGDVS
jgi:hypothetical protein